MVIPILKCFICKHLTKKILKGIKVGCKAFPKGIPEDILDGRVIHTKVVDGQEGEYVYTPKSEKWQE